MIDLRGLPAPESPPRPGACLRVERPEPGLAVVVLDPPHRAHVVLDLPLLRDLDAILDELETSPELTGVVFTGRDPRHFAAGIDLEFFEKHREAEVVERLVAIGQGITERIDGLRGRGIRTVAAIGGTVPGGAYELALACGRIVLADASESAVGLPETRYGVLPAWGGNRRLPRRIGVPAALEVILSGRLYPARRAFERGLVDRLTPPEYLVRVAGEVALGRRSCRARSRGVRAWLIDRNPIALALLEWRGRRRAARWRGGLDPVPGLAVRRVCRAGIESRARARARDREVVSKLALGEACANRVHLRRLEERAREAGASSVRCTRGVVFGAGTMGASIAGAMAEAGIATRLFDPSPATLDASLQAFRERLAARRTRGHLEGHEERAAIDHLDAGDSRGGFRGVDVAVEAVTEQLEVKRTLFAELEDRLPRETIFATNTSSLSVNAIASGLPNPGRVVGLHFFNPVARMPLVEIVRGERTEERAVAMARSLALRLGKTPLLVADAPGFLVNRLLCPYLDEALRLYAGGVDPERLEGVVEAFGMPVGPLRLLDEIGLDVAVRAFASLHVAYGERMKPTQVLEPLLDAGHLGRKSGDGFHVYLAFAPEATPRLSSDLQRLSPPTTRHEEFLDDAEIIDRLFLPMLNEAARCLDEGVVAEPGEVDLASVLGFGFPEFRGGLWRWGESIGASSLLERLDHCASAVGTGPQPDRRPRFEPALRLRG